jgi:hypothetical protein
MIVTTRTVGTDKLGYTPRCRTGAAQVPHRSVITDNTTRRAYSSLPAYYLNLGWTGSQRREDAPERAAGDSGVV